MGLATTGRRIAVQGTVQGVGFRPWVFQLAQRLHVTGTVRNGPEGVTIEAFGPPPALDELLSCLETQVPASARIEHLEWQPLEAEAPEQFSILPSGHEGPARASIPPDLAPCDACRAELRNPSSRRYRYAFTTCAHCGPRFSIATGIPYDRAATTMSGFPMCPDCRREYEDPCDRRFHAQPIACPACGPRLSWLEADGRRVGAGDPLELAAERLLAGDVVAVRGLGGFHLACDATRDATVRELRRRKHRDQKPLAVMVPDLAAAHALADLSTAEAALLTAAARPIVLVRLRDTAVSPAVAPGLRQVGVMLPYTPLHELLLASVARPLVMTSGNRAGEPMAVDVEEAVAHLRGIADGFLVHDRPIASRTDDSVARVIEGRAMVLRRARGYVPQALAAPRPFPEPVLAVGAQQRAAFCLGKGSQLVPGPHVGDLGEPSTLDSYRAMVRRLETFLEVEPRVVAHDLHPDYETTRLASELGAQRLVGVQHHHAHVAAVMAEHALEGPVLGVAYDGTGLGTDGAAWGGEFLLASYGTFHRLATFRPVRLPGGAQAVREPWRAALSVLDDAFDGDAPLERLELFRALPGHELGNVRHLLRSGQGVTQAHGVGRLFDAAAAVLLAEPRAAYEAQLAMALEHHADGVGEPWPFELDRCRDPWEVDLRPAWRALVAGVQAGEPSSRLSARFHATLGAATGATLRALARRHGPRPVVLAGGCFANAVLAGEVVSRLGGLAVFLPARLPPGDGGLAVGQAAVAAARLGGVRTGAC